MLNERILMRVLVVIFFTASIQKTFGQTHLDNIEINKREYIDRVKVEIEEFRFYLSDIVNRNLTNYQRENAIKSALALFIGKGETYSITNEQGQKVCKEPVKVQINFQTMNRKLTLKRFLLSVYLNPSIMTHLFVRSVDALIIDSAKNVSKEDYLIKGHFETFYYSNDSLTIPKTLYNNEGLNFFKMKMSFIDIPNGTIWSPRLARIVLVQKIK
jgi:hypothetical protein